MVLKDFLSFVLPGTEVYLVIHLTDADCFDKYKTISLNRFNFFDNLDTFFFSAPVQFLTSCGFNIQVHINCDIEIYNKIVNCF